MNETVREAPWGEQWARWYTEGLRHSDYAKKVVGVIEPIVQGCSSLLDVGAGCGALCIPLARAFDEIVALDASLAMLDELNKAAQSANVRNIKTRVSIWEKAEAQIGGFDVVLCAHVPGMFSEPGRHIPQLERHAKRFVFLLLGTPKNANRFFFRELWPLVRGESFPEKPDYFAVYDSLYRMGIFANIRLVDYDFDQPFKDINEALLFWKDHMRLSDDSRDGVLRDFLSDRLEPSDGLLWARVAKQSAIIWWQPSGDK
jgi:SAM-dependent methyltransferase